MILIIRQEQFSHKEMTRLYTSLAERGRKLILLRSLLIKTPLQAHSHAGEEHEYLAIEEQSSDSAERRIKINEHQRPLYRSHQQLHMKAIRTLHPRTRWELPNKIHIE